MIAFAVASCFQKFYSTGSVREVNQEQISQVLKEPKVFILHYGDGSKAWKAEKLQVSGDLLSGEVKPLDKAHSKALAPADSSNRVAGKYLADVTQEVHLYTKEKLESASGVFSIPVSSVYRMDIYQFDEKATKRSTTTSIIGIVVVVALIAITAVVATSSMDMGGGCACPEVFIQEQGQYNYVNGVFSGALYSNLERSDYLPMGDIAAGKGITLELRNTRKETQFIDQVELLAVRHREGETVLADRKGNIYGFTKAVGSTLAVDEKGNDISGLLEKKDGQLFRFDADLQDANLSSMVLEFDIPKDEGSILLNVTGRNTSWAAEMNQSFTVLFGKEYPDWRAKKERESPSTMEKWQLEQGLPIKVFIADGNQWKFVDYLPLSGTMAPRDMVMKLDNAGVVNGKLKLKLETVFNFWELDKVALAVGNKVSNIRKIQANGQAPELNQADGRYYVLEDEKNANLQLSFTDPEWQAGTTYFLHAKGYYHNESYYPGPADRKALLRFREGTAFSDFSKSQYRMYNEFLSAKPK